MVFIQFPDIENQSKASSFFYEYAFSWLGSIRGREYPVFCISKEICVMLDISEIKYEEIREEKLMEKLSPAGISCYLSLKSDNPDMLYYDEENKKMFMYTTESTSQAIKKSLENEDGLEVRTSRVTIGDGKGKPIRDVFYLSIVSKERDLEFLLERLCEEKLIFYHPEFGKYLTYIVHNDGSLHGYEVETNLG